MADPVADPNAAPAAPAPAAPAPVVTPSATAAQSPAAPEAAAPSAPTAPAPSPAPAAEPTSILSDAKPDATPPAPAASADPAAQPTPVQSAPAVKPTYEAFKLPDGVTIDQAASSKFTDALAAFELDGKSDHGKMQAFGQSLMDMFVGEMQAHAQRQTQAQLDVFNQAREGWRNEIKADPNFGGDKFQKTVADAGAFIEQYGGTADEVAAARLALRITGAGDHPALIKLFARAGKALAREGAPVPATAPKSPIPISRTQRRYGASLNNGSGA